PARRREWYYLWRLLLGRRRLRRPPALAAIPTRSASLLAKCALLLLSEVAHAAGLHEHAVVEDRVFELEYFEQRQQAHWPCPDVRAQVTDVREAIAHREKRELRRIDVGHLVPAQRRGRARVRHRADRVRRGDRPIERVLPIVDEHAGAILHHPGDRRDLWHAVRDLGRDRLRETAHLGERQLGDDRREDVHAGDTRRLRIRRQRELIEHLLHDHRDLAHVLPRVALARVEIDEHVVRLPVL